MDLFHVSFMWLAVHGFFLVDFLLRRLKRRVLVLKYFVVSVNLVRVADATYLYRIKFPYANQTYVKTLGYGVRVELSSL